MDLQLSGRVAAVAAASKGLGRAVALELAREGADLAICSSDSARIAAAAADIRAATGRQVWAVAADVSSEAGCKAFIDQAAAHFGRLDILVANAGGPPSGPADSFNGDQWRAAIDMNLLSTVHMVYAALPHLRASDQGRVIAITSMSAKQPMDNLVLSNVTRSGVLAFIKTLANELGPSGITFNSVLPGWTRTQRVEDLLDAASQRRGLPVAGIEAEITAMIPVRRMGTVAEFAAAVVYLASKQASFVNGVALAVDGGRVQGLF